eukprot:92893_1
MSFQIINIWRSTKMTRTYRSFYRYFAKKADRNKTKQAMLPDLSNNHAKLRHIWDMHQVNQLSIDEPSSTTKEATASIPAIENISETKAMYKNALHNPDLDLVICTGPAGSGKTYVACDFASESLKNGKFTKIIITRPTVAIEESLGHLPGDINSKMSPWTVHMFDIFEEYFAKEELQQQLRKNIIEISPLGFIQGRTFRNCIIIADEMQNSSIQQMFMLATRLGEGSKMIINGDISQTKNTKNGLDDIVQKLSQRYVDAKSMEEARIKIVKLNTTDIQRHPLVATMVDLYTKETVPTKWIR